MLRPVLLLVKDTSGNQKKNGGFLVWIALISS